MPGGAGTAELREKAEALKSGANDALRQASQKAQRLEAEASRREHEEAGRAIAAGHRAEIRKLAQQAKPIKVALQALAGDLARAQQRAKRQAARITALAGRRQELEAERDQLLADECVPLASFDRVTHGLLQLAYLEPFFPPAIAEAERRVQTLLEQQSQRERDLQNVEGQIDSRRQEAADPFGEERERERKREQHRQQEEASRRDKQRYVDDYNAEQQEHHALQQGTDGRWGRPRARLESDGTISYFLE